MPKGRFDLRAWALVGATQRLRELDEERAAILSTFPQLRGGGRLFPRGRKPRAAAQLATKKRKRRKMSKAAREKIAAAQRARWARQKKAPK
jgi:hypothetical protein